MLINFIIIGSYDDNDSLEISLYMLYRRDSDSIQLIPIDYSIYDSDEFNESKKFILFFFFELLFILTD
jgi:hypothetical protein